MLPRCLKIACMLIFFKGTKIRLECYDDFILFCFEAVEGTADNEPVNIVVVPDKFNNERSNLCDSMMKIYRKNYFYRKVSPISFFPLRSQRRPPTQRSIFQQSSPADRLHVHGKLLKTHNQFWQHFCNIFYEKSMISKYN